jgi:hypothetical protein
MIFLPKKLHNLLSSFSKLPLFCRIESHLCPFSSLTPWRSLNLNFLPIRFEELDLKPNTQTISRRIDRRFNDKLFIESIELAISDIHQININKFDSLTDNI